MLFGYVKGLKSEDGLEEPNVRQRSWRPWDPQVTPLYSWYKLVEMYTSTDLTYDTDKLPALSGLAPVFLAKMDDEYIAGLWRKDLISGLQWWRSARLEFAQGYVASSWSWASVKGSVKSHNIYYLTDVAKIFDLELEVKGSNPFGQIEQSVELALNAPVLRLRLMDDQVSTDVLRLRQIDDESLTLVGVFDDVRIQDEQSLRELGITDLYGLVLTECWLNDGQDETTYVHHLMLITHDAEDRFWRKSIGVAYVTSKEGEFQDLFETRQLRTITWLV